MPEGSGEGPGTEDRGQRRLFPRQRPSALILDYPLATAFLVFQTTPAYTGGVSAYLGWEIDGGPVRRISVGVEEPFHVGEVLWLIIFYPHDNLPAMFVTKGQNLLGLLLSMHPDHRGALSASKFGHFFLPLY